MRTRIASTLGQAKPSPQMGVPFDTAAAVSAWMQHASQLQSEFVHFFAERVSADLRAFSRFAACRSPDDFMRVQVETISDFGADWLEQTLWLFSLFDDAVWPAGVGAAPAPARVTQKKKRH